MHIRGTASRRPSQTTATIEDSFPGGQMKLREEALRRFASPHVKFIDGRRVLHPQCPTRKGAADGIPDRRRQIGTFVMNLKRLTGTCALFSVSHLGPLPLRFFSRPLPLWQTTDLRGHELTILSHREKQPAKLIPNPSRSAKTSLPCLMTTSPYT